MKTQNESSKLTTAADHGYRGASLVEAMGITSTDHGLMPNGPSLAARHPLPPFLFEFLGREPFGFAFMEGQEAKFRVPFGHRFVVEHMNISCRAKDDQLDVQFVTKSSRKFCGVMATPNDGAAPICVQGSSVSTFLFGNCDVRSSSIVPPDTYVQVWGYLEPTSTMASI